MTLEKARQRVATSSAPSLEELMDRLGYWPVPEVSGAMPSKRVEDEHVDHRKANMIEPLELCLCESKRLVLRINRPYVFVEGENCPTCREMADAAREAWGANGGATEDE